MTTNGFEGVDALVPKLRERFNELHAASINAGAYHDADLERVQSDDTLLRQYLLHQKADVLKSAAMMDTSLRFRNEHGLNDLSESHFPRSMHELGAVYFHGEDKKGSPLLIFQVKKNRKDPEKLPLVKKFVAWWIDKHWLKHPEEKIVAVFDMTDAGFGNVDIELLKFQIYCFTTYYPALLDYMLIYEMPWVLNAIWKVIKTLLTSEQQQRVLFVKRAQIQEYIDPEYLPLHMGGEDTYEYVYIPSDDSGIELPNGELMTPVEEQSLSLTPDVSPGTPPGSATKKRGRSLSASLLELTLRPKLGDLKQKAKKSSKVTFAEQDQAVYPTEADDEDAASTSSKGSKQGTLNIAARQRAREDDSYVGPILTISPAEELEFIVTDESKETLDILSLTNNTEKNVAFKVKTTSPEKYRVRPSTGVVKPGASNEISIYLHPGHQSTVSKDKFLVMFVEVAGGMSSGQVNELFRTATRESYKEHRLRCRLGTGKPAAVDVKSPAAMGEQLVQLTKKVERLSEANDRLEKRMGQMVMLQFTLLIVIFLFIATMVLSHWLGYTPTTNYSVNTCLPIHPS